MIELKGEDFASQVKALVSDWDGSVLRRVCHLSNVSALLNEHLQTINWVGFYLRKESEDHLVLGPFQGKIACTDIPFSRGVCGKAASTAKTVRVEDVHLFPGHIACDGASRSELVVPLFDSRHNVVGVLDIDSPVVGRFSADDQEAMECVANVLSSCLWT